MRTLFTLVLSVFTLQSTSPGAVGGDLPPQTPYLLEIVTGRCYERPPSPSGSSQALRDQCPVLVPALIGILQSHLDRDIAVDNFEPYLSQADFSAPRDRALLVLDAGGRQGTEPTNRWGENGAPLDDPDSDYSSYFLPPSLLRPEDTPGGSLLKGLTFCGVDLHDSGCDFGDVDPPDEDEGGVKSTESNRVIQRVRGAQASFWAGVYRAFASTASGRVRIVVLGSELQADEAEEDKQRVSVLSSSFSVRNRLLSAAVVPYLPAVATTFVELYSQSGCDCPIVEEVTRALDRRGIKWSCLFDRDLMRLFRGAGYFLGDQEPPPPAVDAIRPAAAEQSTALSPDKRKGRFHFLRDFAVGLGMVMTGLVTLLLGLGLRGRLQQLQQRQRRGDGGHQYPYDKIPQEVLVQ